MSLGRTPARSELPLTDDGDARQAWDVWGRGDVLGSLNRLTQQTVGP